MSYTDAWVALRHGGNLLAREALESLPEPDSAPRGLADRLRTALVDLEPPRTAASALSILLDLVLEDVCGLKDHWEKGNSLGSAHAERLLDGTVLKPRRRRSGPGLQTLVVFSTKAKRLGVGKGRRPVAHVTEYLRRRSISLSLLTNGTQWRLMWVDQDSLAWVEWETERWLDAGQPSSELEVLRQVISPTTLSRKEGDDSSSLCPLMAAIRDTRRGQAKLSNELGERVRRAVEKLVRSREPLVGPVWNEHTAKDLYVAACHFVMRLVVTLFAEARELLPVDNPIYHNGYGLRSLLDALDRLTPELRRTRHSAWPRLLALFRLLHQGSPHPALSLPSYGGDLFGPGNSEGDGVQRALAVIEGVLEPPEDEVVYEILVLLTRTTQRIRDGAGWRKVAAPVDFTELTSEYIGILYEGLLDYELNRAGEQPVIFLNLGDQPALPLDRLEAMEDKALKALVEKAKVKKQMAAESDDDSDDDSDDEDDDAYGDSSDEDDESDDESESPADEDQGETDDDSRVEARARALAWGRRAAEVAKLVKKPRGNSAETSAIYATQLEAAAAQLVADLKLPGECYLVRWGGTRKGAGTFYTRPQLTLPTVRRTLEPLLYGSAKDDDGTRVVRSPEALLALKVCDPAMGSGSFLVAALRVLTTAVVESLHTYQRIERVNGRTTVHCSLLPEADRHLPTEGFDGRLEANVRRAVVEHCLYGVDLDPLAVELARVALWIETLDKRLPFTFLDHKLRCGDALVGAWLDHFREYPLLCFDRASPDQNYTGINRKGNVWHKALRGRRTEAIGEQVDLLTGQLTMKAATASDEELKAAVERVRRLYRELRAVPAGRPDERARIWRERIQTDRALGLVREAFDTWCALWFWPLEGLDTMPLPSEFHAPDDDARSLVKALRQEKRFFHWELEFPDVFTDEGTGFDAVVGNPPWEIQKPNSKEFFSNHDPLYRAYGKQEALRVQRALFEAHPFIEDQWLNYVGDFKARGNFVKHASEPFGDGKVVEHGGGHVNLVRGKQGPALHRAWRGTRARYRGTSDPEHPFRYQGSADLNSYKMFVEVAHALLTKGGQLGLVVPSGLYTDKGTGDLRRLLIENCRWRWLYGFENRDKLFDIHRSFKFCVIIAEKGGTTKLINAAFMRHDLEDWAEARATLSYPAERVRVFSPKSLSLMEIRSEEDLQVLTKLYNNSILIGDEGPDGWGIEYSREFDMTNDSKLFIGLDKAERRGFKPDLHGRWVNEEGVVLLPLYEGRMVGQFDFSEKGWVSGKGRGAVWQEIPWESKRVAPQYLMPQDVVFASRSPRAFKTVIMNIGSATNRRSMFAATVPDWPANHSLGVLAPREHEASLDLTAALCSFTFDWALRNRLGGLNISWFVLEETPLPRKFAGRNLAAALAGNNPAIATVQVFAGRFRAAITSHERLRLRCILDAIVAALYGLSRDDLAWILKDCDHPSQELSNKVFCRQLDPKGFWRVDKGLAPELRHTVLALVAFDDLMAATIAAGKDREAGIREFLDQNDGDGWMLPETLCVADLGLVRTVNVGEYDERARRPQPVRSHLGERFLDWQLTQTPEESWRECERHAKTILESMPKPSTTKAEEKSPRSEGPVQGYLPGMDD